MSSPSLLQEIFDDVRTELWRRRSQVLAGLSYVLVGFGALYLMSSRGADSGQWYDTHERTTLAAIGVALLAIGVLLGAVTLAVDRDIRRSLVPGAGAGQLCCRRRVVAVLVVGTALLVGGALALASGL